MATYLVRQIGTTKVHGLFWADSRYSLFWAMDEMTNPLEFEFARLPPGGLWHPKGLEDTMPSPQWRDVDDDPEEDRDEEDLMEDLTVMSEGLVEAVSTQARLRWRRFTADDLPEMYGAR